MITSPGLKVISFVFILFHFSCHTTINRSEATGSKSTLADSSYMVYIEDNEQVMAGDNYSAQIALVKRVPEFTPRYEINGVELNSQDGTASYETTVYSVSAKQVNGVVRFSDEEGEKYLPFELQYNSNKPFACIEASELNILYKGITNPISVYVPGATDVVVDHSEGIELEPTDTRGLYLATVNGSQRTVSITAMVRVDGMTRRVGRKYFRVRPLPTPMAQLGNIRANERVVQSTMIKAQTRLAALVGPSFPYSLNYRVTSYRFTLLKKEGTLKRIDVDGPYVPMEVKNTLSNIASGDLIMFDHIEAREVRFGHTAALASIVYEVR